MRRALFRLLEFKWRILAVSAAVVVASSVAMFGYLSFKESSVQGQEEDQWKLATFGPQTFRGLPDEPGIAYRVEIQSIDESAGTAHLKVDVVLPEQELLMGAYMHLSGLTSYFPKSSVPLSFGPLEVFGLSDQMLAQPELMKLIATSNGVLYPNSRWEHFPKFSESPPQTAASDVEIFGEPWWYPFDRYFVAAGVNCNVILKGDKQQSHKLENLGYYLSTQVPPNLIIKRATKEDFNRAARSAPFGPPTSQSFDPDVWKQGLVVLILHRPIFPRFFAVFFGVVAVIWIWVIGRFAETKQLTLNVVGYFLTIWAIRAPLAIGAPKGTTLMDYVTLGLYAILIAVAGFRLLWGYQKSSTS